MVYRDAEEALRQRRGELLSLRRTQALSLPASLVAVYARRQARRFAGAAGIALAALLAFDALRGADGLTTMAQLALPLVALVYAFTRAAAGSNLRARMYRAAYPTADVFGDIERLESWSPISQVLEETRALEARSIAIALAGLSLWLSLTQLVLVFGSVFGNGATDPRESDAWIRSALAYEAPCRIALAIFAWRFGRRLPSLRGARQHAAVAGWQAWAVMIVTCLFAALAFTVAAPCGPAGLYAVGPFVMAATGLVFVPAMFGWAGRVVARERRLLAAMQFSQPTARREGKA